MPQWSEYKVTYAHDEGTADNRRRCFRYVRATSDRDARYRVARKFILPHDAEIVSVERINN